MKYTHKKRVTLIFNFHAPDISNWNSELKVVFLGEFKSVFFISKIKVIKKKKK